MKKWIADRLLSLCGWTLQGQAPTARQYVLIAAPHTSNWDFPWMLLMAWSMRINIHWIGKHTLFKAPFGALMRALGGISVVRDSQQNTVEQIADRFAAGAALILIVPAEGTRSYTKTWRSGFYHIAKGSGVPIVLSFLDYGTRIGGIGLSLQPSDNVVADMNKIRAFYAGRLGKYPKLSGPIVLREEASANTSAD